MAQAIILYEAALGLGIAVGPLVGGVLGSISWRGPFFGVSALMALALVVTTFLLPSTPRAEKATTLVDPFRALAHHGLLGVDEETNGHGADPMALQRLQMFAIG